MLDELTLGCYIEKFEGGQDRPKLMKLRSLVEIEFPFIQCETFLGLTMISIIFGGVIDLIHVNFS